MFQKFIKSFFVIIAILTSMNFSIVYAADWVSISGEVKTEDGIPLCAMVLANGEYMFTCNPVGEYNLYVPLDDNEQITLFAFCDGQLPFKKILNSWENIFNISMSICACDSNGTGGSPDISGVWEFVFTNINSSCGPESGWSSTVTIVQNGSSLEITGFKNTSFIVNGSIENDIVTIGPANFPESGGTTRSTFTLTLASETSMNGKESWTWSSSGDSCINGTGDITATKLD